MKLQIYSNNSPRDGYVHWDEDISFPHLELTMNIKDVIDNDAALIPILHQVLSIRGINTTIDIEEILINHLEHVQWPLRVAFFDFLHRWLMPKGILRIEAVADFDYIIKTISNPNEEINSLWNWINLQIFGDDVRKRAVYNQTILESLTKDKFEGKIIRESNGIIHALLINKDDTEIRKRTWKDKLWPKG